ncbi:hypothetical protein llap_20087 [Limosa lapponica baueri]|uniref:Uncharacterized protein n=1 Tax=Limosa lapponica baueri TaxID=1758121 RepID=A0A2I0T747_LIMLA|nr:hypothetical protein llap_20087 [Limosa lapponica baueri]
MPVEAQVEQSHIIRLGLALFPKSIALLLKSIPPAPRLAFPGEADTDDRQRGLVWRRITRRNHGCESVRMTKPCLIYNSEHATKFCKAILCIIFEL